GIDYLLAAVPTGAAWDFGDGEMARFADSTGYGNAYPQPSSVTHIYAAHDQSGYRVGSSVRYEVSWTVSIQGRRLGPYPLGMANLDAQPLQYPVEQAQPELIGL
ncbi:MAG: hypothetical protein QOI23_2417, partial [Chloroflexota bacterium]|nr:hypothetical protein [Chloroflexota bacterium]